MVWHWGPGNLDHQHHASILPSGNILLFDNGRKRGFSRIIEFEPHSKRVVWSFGDPIRNKFYSFERGGAQKLPNGNVLVTVAAHSSAFEVTPDKKKVWKLKVVASKKRDKAQLYRIIRVAPDSAFLKNEDGTGLLKL